MHVEPQRLMLSVFLQLLLKIALHLLIYFVCVNKHILCTHVEVQGQIVETGSLLPLHGFQAASAFT